MFLGVSGLTSTGGTGASAYVSVFCDQGMPRGSLVVRDPQHGTTQTAVAPPGTAVRVSVTEAGDGTSLVADDLDTGASAELHGARLATPDSRFLVGSLNRTATTPLTDFRSAKLSGAQFDGADVTAATATAVDQTTNGVLQAKTGALKDKTHGFTVTWKHS